MSSSDPTLKSSRPQTLQAGQERKMRLPSLTTNANNKLPQTYRKVNFTVSLDSKVPQGLPKKPPSVIEKDSVPEVVGTPSMMTIFSGDGEGEGCNSELEGSLTHAASHSSHASSNSARSIQVAPGPRLYSVGSQLRANNSIRLRQGQAESHGQGELYVVSRSGLGSSGGSSLASLRDDMVIGATYRSNGGATGTTVITRGGSEPETENGLKKTILNCVWKLVLPILGRISWDMLPTFALVCLVILFLFPKCSILIALLCGYMLYEDTKSKQSSRRCLIKWTIKDFSQESRKSFLTGPPFSGSKYVNWRLIIAQKMTVEGMQIRLGLIMTDIPLLLVKAVNASIKLTCTNGRGEEVFPGMSQIRIPHLFEKTGDCLWAKPIILSRDRVGPEDLLSVVCRIEFNLVMAGVQQRLRTWFVEGGEFGLRFQQGKNENEEFGIVWHENLELYGRASRSGSGCSTALNHFDQEPLTRFISHPETKTFLWEIPNLTMIASEKNGKDVWGICSPLIFVGADERLKLVEIAGVFQLRIQCRGLPKGSEMVKFWHLVQMVDAMNESVVPDAKRIRFPEHLKQYSSFEQTLFRRQTLLSRFVKMDGSVSIRFSLQVAQNDIPVLEKASDVWIR